MKIFSHKIKAIKMKTLPLIAIGALLLSNFLIQAQPSSKIRPEDYHKWGELKDEEMAPDGKWISYKMDYTIETDTLFLQKVATGERQNFPNATQAVFTSDSNWFLYTVDNFLTVLNLKTNTNKKFKNVKKYAFNKATRTLAILKGDGSSLLLYKSNRQKTKEIANIKDFSFNSNGTLAMATDKGIEILNQANDVAITILKDSESEFSTLTWDASGKNLVFFKTAPNGKTTAVCYYMDTSKLQFLQEEVTEQMKVELQFSKPLSFSPRNDCVFLYTKSSEKPSLSDDKLVEVWDAATPFHYPAQKQVENIPYTPKLHLWDLKNNNFKKIIPDSLPFIKLMPDSNYALAYNPTKIGHQHLVFPLVDYYLINLTTTNINLILQSQSTSTGLLSPSPSAPYIGYYNDSGWNIYNFKTSVNNLIFNKAWIDKQEEDEKYKSTSPGWTNDGEYMVLYIGLDVWLISPDGSQKKRITNGKETGIKFRPVTDIQKSDRQFLNEEISAKYFNLTEGIILHGFLPDKTTSIYKWTPSDGLILLHKSQSKILVRSKSTNGHSILLEKQTASHPPSLWLLDCNTKKVVLLYQSNSHYKKYELPRTKLLSYKNEKEKELNAILHYPKGYDQNKKYPMIVYVYELLSQNLYTYNNPSLYNSTGFNLANYTNDGYFVLMPDITYTIGDPGTSAVDCVLKAVSTALLTANLDKNRIGLTGHSYGGHETSLMITKTNLFAAAVAGAASTNMISDYLSLNEVTQVNKFWKFESHQYRMGVPPFGNWEAYVKNSPVMNAERITTPLLSWTGKADGTVDWRQSVELHLALKRLTKINTLLVYPNEGHIINNREAQFDLTSRIKKWFDKYLK
jgi:dipeptidyl aminopeptidase/acylaminoacyl peptidase